MEILRGRRTVNPMDSVQQVVTAEQLLALQQVTLKVTMKDDIIEYITKLAGATRSHEHIRLGVSPRGALAVSRMARACALMRDRDYVIPEDVQEIFLDVCAHRILLSQQARNERLSADDVLNAILRDLPMPR